MENTAEGPDRVRLLTIVGPTATGKSDLSIRLASEFRGEIINADSRLVYRGMDIGTAKPSPEEMALVPHHLINLIPPTQSHNLAAYLRAARNTIRDIAGRGAMPILVGGSGQYVWALLEGWNVPEIPIDTHLRAELEQMLAQRGLDFLQRQLLRLDPAADSKVDMQNPRRVLRAVERAIATGDAMAGATKSDQPPYDALIIGLSATRDVLRSRITRRIDAMLDAGWLDEVRALVGMGIGVKTQSMYSIGYREMLQHISGKIGLDEAKELTVKATMRLVDSQENWFKKSDSRIKWFDIRTADYAVNARFAFVEWYGNEQSEQPRR